MGIKGSMPFLSIYSITTDKETEKKKEAEASFLKHNALQLRAGKFADALPGIHQPLVGSTFSLELHCYYALRFHLT